MPYYSNKKILAVFGLTVAIQAGTIVCIDNIHQKKVELLNQDISDIGVDLLNYKQSLEDTFDELEGVTKDYNLTIDKLQEKEDQASQAERKMKEQEEEIDHLNEELSKLKKIKEEERRVKKLKEKEESEKQVAISEVEEIPEIKKETKTNNSNASVKKEENQSINVEITAYTAECNGCSGITATGIDVTQSIYHQGDRVIAADPSVIPLNSKVEVTMNGSIFIARVIDTGGAIKGNKVDLLVNSKEEALNIGRVQGEVKIIK